MSQFYFKIENEAGEAKLLTAELFAVILEDLAEDTTPEEKYEREVSHVLLNEEGKVEHEIPVGKIKYVESEKKYGLILG